MNADEAIRRKSNTEKLREFFLLRPLEWINAREFEEVAGRQAWRSRLAELRILLQKENAGTIENRQTRRVVEDGEGRKHVEGPIISEYRFLPWQPQGRDAATHSVGLPLFDDGPWSHS